MVELARIGRIIGSGVSFKDPTLVASWNFRLRAGSAMSLASRNGAPAMTFTRASGDAAYFDENALLVKAAINAPRFDHDPVTGAARGLLIEEQRENLCLQSEDFATTWSSTRVTITTNSIAGPDGNTTADKIADNTDNDSHFVRQVISVTSGTAYTFYVFAKAGAENGLDEIFLDMFTSFPTASTARFNLTDGTVIAEGAGADSSGIIDVGGGWFLCFVTSTANATATNNRFINLSKGGLSNYAGTGEFVYLWGTQFEASSSPTSYIATTSAAVTRSADVCSTADLGWFNESVGTLYAEFSLPVLGLTRIVASVHGGADTHGYRLFARSTNESEIDVKDTANVQAVFTPGALLADIRHKLILAYATSDFAGTLNGASPGTDTSGNVPTSLTTLSIGNQATGNVPLNGHITEIKYWNVRKPNAFLQSITA